MAVRSFAKLFNEIQSAFDIHALDRTGKGDDERRAPPVRKREVTSPSVGSEDKSIGLEQSGQRVKTHIIRIIPQPLEQLLFLSHYSIQLARH